MYLAKYILYGLLISPGILSAQRCATLRNVDGAPIEKAQIAFEGVDVILVSDEYGSFCLPQNLEPQTATITHIGYKPVVIPLSDLGAEIILDWAVASLPAFEIHADRSQLYHPQSLVKIETINPAIFDRSQAINLAEGLGFSPALRVENNCQNCGFTQVRMNGLPGNYTQIVINGRPVFSALTGVYGLEFIPAGSIGKVEVLRGGGSALYGSNAIAGILNVVTKSPEENATEGGFHYTSTGMASPDRLYHFGTSRVSEDGHAGIRIDYAHRNRDSFDANGDEFTEITRLRQDVITSQSFWKPSDRSRLGFDLMYADDLRRGGSDLNRPPHESQIAEQLDHQVLSTGLTYEQYSKDLLGKWTIYGSLQNTNRDSYYGTGGRQIHQGDTIDQRLALALNAYGNTTDQVWLGGGQYARQINQVWDINAGFESRSNTILDAMPGYGRSIDQKVSSTALYTQATAQVNSRFSLSAGGRLETSKIEGEYVFPSDMFFTDDSRFNIAVGRVMFRYSLNEFTTLRASYAGGFRLPQAFDEDLHIEAIGGEARMVVFDEQLNPERSHSYLFELSWEGRKMWQLNLTSFYTNIDQPFITADARQLDSGISIVEKRNGSGAFVAGSTADMRIEFSKRWSISGNLTGQVARYNQAELLWQSQTDENLDGLYTTIILRTPDWYGSAILDYTSKNWAISLSGQFTGRMYAPRVVDITSERIVLIHTPRFADIGIKVERSFKFRSGFECALYMGCYNVFNSFQQDFESGPDRDANFVFGPMRPRSAYAGIRLSF
jgi:outer membrane receptor for ferrienterochelin and colicins